MTRLRRAVALSVMSALLVVGVLAFPSGGTAGSGPPPPPPPFADWLSVHDNQANGTLGDYSVTLSGSAVADVPASNVDGTSDVFNQQFFDPPFAQSDEIYFSGFPGYSYTLSFGGRAENPRLHLANLASRLVFPAGTSITLLSGDPGISVQGNAVVGTLAGSSDANGSVQLNGTFDSIHFTAEPVYSPATQPDGIYMHVGGKVLPPAPPPPPPPPDEGNLTKPTVRFDFHVGKVSAYFCSNGTWKGIPAGATFTKTWWQDRGLGSLTSNPIRQIGTGSFYALLDKNLGRKVFCEVEVTSSTGKRLVAFSDTTVLTGPPEKRVSGPIGPVLGATREYGNFRVRGIDLFQTVQPNDGAQMFGYPNQGGTSPRFPLSCGGGTPTEFRFNCNSFSPPDPTRTLYKGVPLDADKPTVAVAYVDMAGARASDLGQPLDVTIRARLGNQLLPGTPTVQGTDPPVSSTPWVLQSERGNPAFGVRFTVPQAWLREAAASPLPFSLEAQVALPTGAGGGLLRECALLLRSNCTSDDRFTVQNVTVDQLPLIRIRSLALVCKTQGCPNLQTSGSGRIPASVDRLSAPTDVLASAINLYPGGNRATVEPYSAEVDISWAIAQKASDLYCDRFKDSKTPLRDCHEALVVSAVSTQWWDKSDKNRTGYDILLGVHRFETEPGWETGGNLFNPNPLPWMLVNDGSLNRPITAAAHEFGHAIDLVHADGGLTPTVASGGCGGGADGQIAEVWSPDGGGRLQGVAWNGGPQIDTPANPIYDLMSYCPTPPASAFHWLSARNWNHVDAALHAWDIKKKRIRARSRLHSAQAGTAFVAGILSGDGAQIVRVFPPDAGNLVPAADPSSPLHVAAKNAGGGQLGDVGAHIQTLHNHGDPVAVFTAPIPSGATAVDLVSAGKVLDHAARSRAPTVKLLAPKRGTRVGKSLDVRWKASDPDGDLLAETVDYSANGQNGWRTVYTGENATHATVPGSFLEASRHARVRVTVNDSFSQARAVSAPFIAAGAPPQPRILSPIGRAQLQAGVPVQLSGSALDDRRERLRGSSLTWFAGSRRLGHGESLRVRLGAGKTKLRLVARDRLGRRGTAVRKVTVAPVPLRLVTLGAPDHVKPKARKVALTVTTTTAATLHARGISKRVGTHKTRVLVPLPAKPRRAIFKIPITIRARGKKQPPVRTTLFVLRS